ncbi:spire type actin nucleation factor 2 [Willisornis vidua]|uniref:Spire type actin nucleation factor 2 n=1 Tax=Willisornis vidua TaxID=1566151 RepID=A0ABQ9DQS1_9PASS|nr:spire type actin nucleation factor 2 [Willisornis vidua]
MVQSLGFAVYRALDWGLDENEERELSPRLEQLIDLMTNSDSEDSGCATADEGYGGQEEEDEGAEGPPRSVRTFGQAMRCCAARLADPAGAPAHYQAVCRALFAETVELMAFLAKIRDAKELLQKLKEDEEEEERPAAELGSLRNTDWARLWVQLMRELRHGVKLKKVQEKQFNPLPTEYQLTPFEMLMQDIRARNYKLRKVMVDGDIPPRVKKDAHELILDFIRSRPPLKQASERRLRPLPQKQRTLHEKILEEIRQERKLRPVDQKGSVPASCHRLPDGPAPPRAALGAVEERPEDGSSTAPTTSSKHLWLDFSHPVESLALTVEEMINVRRVLVKAEMEKFLQSKELYSSLRKGKVCCCCRAKFPIFSWPAACLFCKRSVCSSCSLKEDNDLEDIDSLLERLEDPGGLCPQSQGGLIADSRPLLYVEHRNLNPENELKRYFGARAVLGDQRPRQRQRQYVRSTWLTAPKNTWPRYSKTGEAFGATSCPQVTLVPCLCGMDPGGDLSAWNSELLERELLVSYWKYMSFLNRGLC